MITNLIFGFESPCNNDSVKSEKKQPYSEKLTYNDVNAKVIKAEEINEIEEILVYFFNEINVVSTSGFQINTKSIKIWDRFVNLVKGKTQEY